MVVYARGRWREGDKNVITLYLEEKMMKLNVGCGSDFWGDIRLDVTFSHPFIKIVANILGDAQCLPFRDKVFQETRCFHVLEHIEDPLKAFRELRRVTYGSIQIRVPINHLFSFLIEAVWLILTIILTPLYIMKNEDLTALKKWLRYCSHWKERYSDHRWYIRFKNARIKRQWGIPKEYMLEIVEER